MSSESSSGSGDASTALTSTSGVTATGVSSCKAVTLALTLSKPQIALMGAYAETVNLTISVTPGTYSKKITLSWTDGLAEVYRFNNPFKQPRENGATVVSGMFKSTVYVKAVAGGKVTFTLAAPQAQAETGAPVLATAELTIDAVSVAIKGEDGGEPAKTVLFEGKPPRSYAAVMNSAVPVKKYDWDRKAGAGTFDAAANKAKVEVTARGSAHGGSSASVEVRATVGMVSVSATHAFTIVVVAITDDDLESKPRTTILRGTKRMFAAVTTPGDLGGTYAWTVTGEHIAITSANAADYIIEVSGNSAGTGQLTLTYTLNGQTAVKTLDLAVAELGIVKRVVYRPLNLTTGAVAEFTASGADENLTWTTDNTIDATFGKTNEVKAKLTSASIGVAPLKLKWKVPDSDEPERTVDGAAVFVGLWLTGITCAGAAKRTLTKTSTDEEKKVAMILPHSGDPATWKLGKLVVEAEGGPASVDTCGETATGAYTWTPGAHVAAVFPQPADHGTDNAAFALALPNADAGGPDSDTTETITVKYKVGATQVEDALEVTVHMYGCSAVRWQRSGAANVTVDDQPVPCLHKARPQHKAIANGREVGGLTGSHLTGHQHGSDCPLCSHESVRPIFHYVALTADVLTRARALADALVKYVKNDTTNSTWGNLTTANVKAYLKDSSKMLGVLRGVGASDAEVWRYALSGHWKADGDWCVPLTFASSTYTTDRTLTHRDGKKTTYSSDQNALNADGIDESFQKFGRCAAPVLLERARTDGLKNLELAEVWLHVGGPATGFTHKDEIGSCHQCRRFLGRTLCEVGT